MWHIILNYKYEYDYAHVFICFQVATIGSVLLGAILGFIVRVQQPTPQTIMLLSFPGEILMHMLKMMILPLIASSLISGKELCYDFVENMNVARQ